jgi:sensor histidine kinase YesM
MQLIGSGLKENWFKSLLIAISWGFLTGFIMTQYGLAPDFAFLEAFLQVIYLLLGLWFLGNIFKFYLPEKKQLWISFTLPLIFASSFTYLHFLIFKNWMIDQEYFLFIKHTLWLKGFYFYICFQFWTILLIMSGKIEDQNRIREKEIHTRQIAKEAEMYHLRQQLQPHFLFNSLNSISAMVNSRPEAAREMIIQLSEFLRGIIRKDVHAWVPMTEELAQLEKFLYIEKVRFRERLQISLDISEMAKKCTIPQLLIQPLLENAIKHGLYGITGDVKILIAIRKEKGKLVIKIQNPYDPQVGQAKGSGFGLIAVQRRLQLLFGRNDLLKISKLDRDYIVNLEIPQPQ